MAESAQEETQEGSTDELTRGTVEATGTKEASEEASEEVTETESPEPAAWRLEIKSDEAREFAESSTDIDHLANRALDMRKKLAGAIFKPGETATEEDIIAFNEALGIPVTVKGYEIKTPEHLSEEVFESEEVQGQINGFTESMFAASAPKNVVDAAFEWYWKAEAAGQEALEAADKQFADEGTAELKADWGKDYDVNLEFSNRGMEYLFGDNVTAAREIEMKDGKFLLDNLVMIRALADIGRQTTDAGLGPSVMTEETRGSTQKEHADMKKEQHDAYYRGDHAEAKRLQPKLDELASKLGGDGPLVGDAGRQI